MNEHYSRVQQMILDDGGTWDLSPNDKAALRHVLGLVNSLAEDVGLHSGNSIPSVIRYHTERVSKFQEKAADMRSETNSKGTE